MSGFNTPIKDGANNTVKTPDTLATVMDNGSFHGSPTNEYCQNLETINEQLLIDNNILKQKLRICLPEPGETPSTVLVVRHPDGSEYTEPVYTWELVPYTTEHRDNGLPVINAEGKQIAKSVNTNNELTSVFEAESIPPPKKRGRYVQNGGKKCITRRKRGGNKKSFKRTKKR